MPATGAYPELQGRSARGRSRFFASYVASILGRDLQDVANVRNVENVERLLFIIAARSGGLASFHGMAGDLGVDTNTVRAHTKILEGYPRRRSLIDSYLDPEQSKAVA